MRIDRYGVVGVLALMLASWIAGPLHAQIAIRGGTIYTMDEDAGVIRDGVVLVRDGRIERVGPASDVGIPEGYKVLRASVVLPGLIDAHSAVGLSGQYNNDHDQDQLERSEPVQPELRAIDAYNPHERLVGWLRSFGVTTVHTGHAPGELISGQTAVLKTAGNTVSDAVVVPEAMVAATLGESAQKSGSDSPGTRAKMVAMLRAALLSTQTYMERRAQGRDDNAEGVPDRDLGKDVLARVLRRELPLLITANRSQDIMNALRLQEEFGFRLVLDGAAEAYLLIDELKQAQIPVVIHPTMARAVGEMENMSFQTAATLYQAGIRVVFQSGYESYVPKTRCVLFEAAEAMANGMDYEAAIAAITIEPARLLGIADRVGSISPRKDADIALFDGDPFEFTTHCIGVLIDGNLVSDKSR